MRLAVMTLGAALLTVFAYADEKPFRPENRFPTPAVFPKY